MNTPTRVNAHHGKTSRAGTRPSRWRWLQLSLLITMMASWVGGTIWIGYARYQISTTAPEYLTTLTTTMAAIAWIGLLLAAGLAATCYIMWRERRPVAIKNLEQSINAIIQGNLQNPVWGTEREDDIGALARTVDTARSRFWQIPDMCLLPSTNDKDSPLYLRFSGETRTVFETMMKNMAENYERARLEITTLATNVTTQSQTVMQISNDLAAILVQLRQREDSSGAVFENLAQKIESITQEITATHQRTTADMQQLIPYMQERANGMAEVTGRAGQQMTQALEAMMQCGQEALTAVTQTHALSTDMVQSHNQLGEKMFDAVNIVQTSGKLMTETLDHSCNSLDAVVATLSNSAQQITHDAAAQNDWLATQLKEIEQKLETIGRVNEGSEALTFQTAKDSALMVQQQYVVIQEIMNSIAQLKDHVADLDYNMKKIASEIVVPEDIAANM